MLQKIRQLKNHAGFKKYFANTSWLMGERILRMVMVLFVGVYVARYLGPEQFGLLSYVISFVGLFTVIATLGLDDIVIRKLIKHPEQHAILLGTAFGLKIIGTFMMWGSILLILPLTTNDNQTNLFIAIIAFATIFQSFNVIDFNYRAEVKSKYVVHAQLIQLIVSSVVKIVLIVLAMPLIWFAWILVLDAIVLALGLIIRYVYHQGQLFQWQWRWQMAKDLLKESWPLIFSGMVLMIQARIDQVMLKEMVGTTEVGYYSVALRLIEAVAFAPMVLKSSLTPAIITAKKQTAAIYQSRLCNYYRLNFLLFLIVAIPLYFFAEHIVILLFGIDYQPAGILLALMAIRLLFANMGIARGLFILTENLFKYSLFTMIIGTISNIILNYFLIPYYQSIGAIISTAISFFITVFMIDLFYHKTQKNVLLMVRSIFSVHKINFRGS